MAKKPNYASLYTLRKDGRYQGYYYDSDGKRKIVYDKDPEKLWHKLNDLKEDSPVLFREIAELWHDDHWDSIRGGTKSSYKSLYEKALERLGDREAADITARDIATHLNTMKSQGLSKSTIKIQRTVYSQIFQYAMIQKKYEKIILHNPAANLKLPSGLPQAKNRVAPEDNVVKEIQKKAQTAYFGLFAMFLLCTGFRRGEALGVQWGDIDFQNDTITCSKQVSTRGSVATVAQTKTENGNRIVPLLPPLKKVLIKPKGAKPGDYVFSGEDRSKPMPGATYDRKWLHYCKDMGFIEDTPEIRVSKTGRRYTYHNIKPTLTAHTLRHGYATILFEADVDVYTAQKLLGHADVTTTMAIYTHLRENKKAQSVDKLRKFSENGL